MNRREFVTWVGIGGLAASLPVALAACNPSGTGSDTADTPETAAGTDETETASGAAAAIAVGSISDLDSQGSLVVEDPEKIIVVRDPADESQVIALTANCNHQNCTVGWNPDDQTFVCPCHDSTFALDGTLQDGPATESLQPRSATIEGDQILVSA